ncbi:MAG: four helix bundle protein [Candidatus Omnitrophica bacterium]|nr:four helix bundle protein [Candidatus Omnitrophota bacterium]MCF7893783.1 four helix bundle protein [Candidatus Omnitrophota bacterium]
MNKLGIARRESRESRHWLKLIERVSSITNKTDKDELIHLIDEAKEILLILSAIINNTKK